MTREDINNTIKNCNWLSQNRGGNLFPDICVGECLPCSAVIESGNCKAIQKLFKAESEEKK